MSPRVRRRRQFFQWSCITRHRTPFWWSPPRASGVLKKRNNLPSFLKTDTFPTISLLGLIALDAQKYWYEINTNKERCQKSRSYYYIDWVSYCPLPGPDPRMNHS